MTWVSVAMIQLSPVSFEEEQAMVAEVLPMVRRAPVPRPPASHKPRVVAPTLPPSGVLRCELDDGHEMSTQLVGIEALRGGWICIHIPLLIHLASRGVFLTDASLLGSRTAFRNWTNISAELCTVPVRSGATFSKLLRKILGKYRAKH